MINETNIACMCPECENINLFRINIFSFSGKRKKTYDCQCGHSRISVVKNSNKSFSVDVLCPVCKEEHSFVIPSNQFWSDDIFSFPCPFYEATSLIIGKGEKLENAVKDYINEELGGDCSQTYMPEFPIVEKILSLIADVEADPDKYKFCSCGGNYSTAYNEKSVYIICDECGYSKKIDYEEMENNNM